MILSLGRRRVANPEALCKGSNEMEIRRRAGVGVKGFVMRQRNLYVCTYVDLHEK